MKTKQILTSDAIPGMIVSEDIYTSHNHLIAAKNTALSDRIITRLKFYSIESITVKVEGKEETNPDQIFSAPPQREETYSEYIKSSKEFVEFNDTFMTTVDGFQDSLNKVMSQNKEIDTIDLLKNTNKVLEKSRNSYHVLSMLHRMRELDDLTYVHSVNVSLMCTLMGRWLDFPEDDIQTLSLCGLLHDIGKLAIPDEIIHKKKRLINSEYTIVKQHTIKGYEILKDKNINQHIKLSALMHHERCDGSGYPHGLKADKIDEFAKIVGIVDVYDAMTSARPYRGPLCPFEAIEVFESEGLKKYDPRYILTFLTQTAQTYLNNEVQLSNGRKAKIVMLNKHRLAKPIVQTENDTFIDLMKKPNISIVKLL